MTLQTITFDETVSGATMTAVGDSDPIVSERTQVSYGAPTVESLSSEYAAAQSHIVYRSGVWNGVDIVLIRSSSSRSLDIHFGVPGSGASKVTIDMDDGSNSDLMAGQPVSGWRFEISQTFVIGDMLHFYCAAHENATGRSSKMAWISADLNDLQAEATTPFTLHAVSDEANSSIDGTGGIWAIADAPYESEGSYWVVSTDYASGSGKHGGQHFLTEYDSDGNYVDTVNWHDLDAIGEDSHGHGGCITYDPVAEEFVLVCHYGDGNPRVITRTLTNLSDYNTNAVGNVNSGIGGSYRIKDAHSSDWGPVVVAAGVDLSTTLTGASNASNNLVLGHDRNDPSKFLYGSDTGSGMVLRGEFDSNGVAVFETVFNPSSRSNAAIEANQSRKQFSLLYVSRNDSGVIAGIVYNEISNAGNATEYSGIVMSTDEGQTWGWVIKGDRTSGFTGNGGIAVTQGGKIVVGTVDTVESVRIITPGAAVSGKSIVVGKRPANGTNLLGNASAQQINNSGGGALTSSTSPPQGALPYGATTYEYFSLNTTEATNGESTRLCNANISEDAKNLYVMGYTQRLDPTGANEIDRMTNTLWKQFAINGGAGSSSAEEWVMQHNNASSRDWTRFMGVYDPDNYNGTFPNNCSLFMPNRGIGLAATTGRFAFAYEGVWDGLDRPPLPLLSPTDYGVASGKFTGLALGTSWTVLVVAQVPEDCWDVWSGDEAGVWAAGVPMFSIADATDTNTVTFQGFLEAAALGGIGGAIDDADFNWGLLDSESATPTEVRDYPVRTMPVVVAISKSGAGDLQYAISAGGNLSSGTRAMAVEVDADTIRLCSVDESEALEMGYLKIQHDRMARSSSGLESLVKSAEISTGGLRSRDRSRER